MKIIDISGSIYTGMWSYADYYPKFELSSVEFEFGGEKYSVEVYKGMHSQAGTYMETPAITSGSGKHVALNDIPIEKFFMIDTYVLQVPQESLKVKDGRPYITVEQIKAAEKSPIPQGAAILVGSGYGSSWDKKDYIEKAWFFKKEALDYITDKKPFLLGGDSPVWENAVNPEGAFERFYKSGSLLLAPCVNLEKVTKFKVKIVILPIKVMKSAVCPVRALIVEE